jgi:hypothetical protein
MKTEIYNKGGSLSEYGLSCGYVETCTDRHKELHKEGGVYHVRTDLAWQSFDKLSAARKAFKEL